MQRVFLAATLAALFPTISSAAVVIDDFNSPDQVVFSPEFFGIGPTTEDTASSVFGTRFIQVTRNNASGNVSATSGDGLFQFNEGQVSRGTFTIGLDGVDDGVFNGNSGVTRDFAADGDETGFRITAGSQFGINLLLTVFNGASQFMTTLNLPSSTGTLSTFFVPFADFSGADFNNVTGFSVQGQADDEIGGDVAIASIVTGTPIPEPMSLTLAGLLGVGLCGGACRRKKRASVA